MKTSNPVAGARCVAWCCLGVVVVGLVLALITGFFAVYYASLGVAAAGYFLAVVFLRCAKCGLPVVSMAQGNPYTKTWFSVSVCPRCGQAFEETPR